MNPELVTMLLDQLVAPLLAGFVFGARLKTPHATDAEIAIEAEGDVRHYLRGKLGFMVDVLWSFTQFTSLLDTEVTVAVASNQLPSALTALMQPPATTAPGLPPAAFVAPPVGIAPYNPAGDAAAPAYVAPKVTFVPAAPAVVATAYENYTPADLPLATDMTI
jgi:hypothetical protein